MAKILIRRHQELVSIRLRTVEQRTVAKVRPTPLESGIHRVSRKMPAEGRRHALVEQDSQATESFKSRVSWSSTCSTCERSTPGNHSRNCSMVAPSLRFSKSAATGTRVPQNTQAPLTFSGSRSTAEQDFQVVTGSPPLPSCRRFRQLSCRLDQLAAPKLYLLFGFPRCGARLATGVAGRTPKISAHQRGHRSFQLCATDAGAPTRVVVNGYRDVPYGQSLAASTYHSTLLPTRPTSSRGVVQSVAAPLFTHVRAHASASWCVTPT